MSETKTNTEEAVKTRGRKPKTKQYFTKETEDAILLYNKFITYVWIRRLFNTNAKTTCYFK